MVYAGTETTTWQFQGTQGLLYSATDFDADAEASAGVDSWAMGQTYSTGVLLISRTAGATALISFKVQGSMDNVIWEDTDIIVTAKDVYDWHPTPDLGEPDVPTQSYRYWRFVCTTVGTANTLDAELWLYR